MAVGPLPDVRAHRLLVNFQLWQLTRSCARNYVLSFLHRCLWMCLYTDVQCTLFTDVYYRCPSQMSRERISSSIRESGELIICCHTAHRGLFVPDFLDYLNSCTDMLWISFFQNPALYVMFVKQNRFILSSG